MAPEIENKQAEPVRQADFQELLHEKMRHAVRLTLIEVLEEEVSDLIGAQRYERTASRRDQRNGYYTRDLGTSAGTIVDLPVPRTRQGFRTRLFERYQRRQAELDEAIAEMFVYGVSTRRVGEVVEGLTGDNPSPSTVSRVFHPLEGEFQAWKERPLEAEYRYVFADGTYFTVIYDAQGCKTPILAVVGIDMAGKRDLLAFTVGDRENQQAWEDVLGDLKQRGVQHVGLAAAGAGCPRAQGALLSGQPRRGGKGLCRLLRQV